MKKEVRFEIKAKDVGGRICRLEIGKKAIETPALMPVYSPGRPSITPGELKDVFGCGALMTNSYIILKNPELKEKVLEKGIHDFLSFDGIIATDSGSYQLMEYGNVTVSNKEIIDFQERIGSDIGSFLDVPTLPDAYKPRAEEQLDLTLERAKEALDARFLVNAGIQGSTYTDLRAKAAREMGRDYRLCAVGGIVKLMESYRFLELVDIISTVKQNIPRDRIVHAFGLGHPMVFPLAAALGCDLFDSAAYALYAADGRYLTAYGTKKLDELSYLPCSCPVCSRHGTGLKELPGEEKTTALARHNLYVSMQEINTVKEAIHEGSLWELVDIRCRSHPQLYRAYRLLLKQEWLAEADPITKRSGFSLQGEESGGRTEVVNAKKRLERVDSINKAVFPAFGEVPWELSEIYPYNSLKDLVEYVGCKTTDLEKIRTLMDYQFGKGAGELIPEKARIKRSRKTGRIRWIYEGKDMIAAVRASDHYIIPHENLAKRLHERFPKPLLRVVVDDEAVESILEGKSVFAKFVKEMDPDLRAGDEVLVVDGNDRLLRTATLKLSPKEALDFERGVAATTR
ncbi:MAG: tRNA guanosine(15) transglycosylase TgtA [Candidatus Altiarchaeota archaeon]|nr:tRNA guanosine(15) transglycosylase TgtA [Candidatus Altiarchaeota archaeon]